MIRIATPVIKEYFHANQTFDNLEKSRQRIHRQEMVDKKYFENIVAGNESTYLEIWSLIDPWLYIHVNTNLVTHGFLPLASNEYIKIMINGKSAEEFHCGKDLTSLSWDLIIQ